MGFGTLLFGYFLMFAFSLSNVYFFADIVGAFIVLLAFQKLARYNRYFIAAMWADLGFLLLAATSAASLMFTLYDPTGPVDLAIDIGKAAAACTMHVFLFLGIRGISLGAESKKLVERTESRFTVTMLYYLANVILLTCYRLFGEAAPYVSVLVYVFSLICLVYNLALFYQCFGILCPADENETERKRSRFAIVNRLNDKFDEIEANKEAYRRESMKKAMAEADRLAKEKEKKYPHKKRKK